MSAERDKIIIVSVSSFIVGCAVGFFGLVAMLNNYKKEEEKLYAEKKTATAADVAFKEGVV